MLLRPLQPGDRPEMERMLAATGCFNEADRALALELIDDALEKGERSDYRFICAEGKKRLAGYACFGKIPLTEASYDLYWIVVDPAAKGQGLGRRLLEAASEECLAQGGRHLYAETSSTPAYAAARAFYEATGFELVSQLTGFYAPGNDKLIYSKRLA
jgi:ribosomal protein S18 acetylase RimI-like enzyme